MTSLGRFATSFAFFLAFGACSEDENPHAKGSAPNDGGEGGAVDEPGGAGLGGKGTGGQGGKGGSSTGSGGEAGEAGTSGEPTGGTAGRATGGSAGSAGTGNAGSIGEGGDAGQGGDGGSGGSCTTVDVPLKSAGFDQDTASWIPYDDGIGSPRAIIVAADSQSLTADSPPNVAHLGGANSDSAGMLQPITIPAGAISMTLTGYRQVKTQEGMTRLDEMAIQLWQNSATSTGFIGEFLSLGNDNPADAWTPFTGTVAVDEHAGQTVDLDMWAETDVSLLTDFYVDSLLLTAVVCR